jgi:hypothetical protein
MKEKMNEKRWKQKTFTKWKILTTFPKERFFFFFFFFLRFYTTNSKEFYSTMSYLSSNFTSKTYEIKDFSLANDAETHSLTKEENEKRFYLFI